MPLTTNAAGCCEYTAPPESAIIEFDPSCVPEDTCCTSQPTNRCGLTHPVGSGTIAGCKSTTKPHFGVVLGAKEGTCHKFGYYTSGNTDEYEDLCGVMQVLSAVEVVTECVTSVEYSTNPCIPCDEVTGSILSLESRVAANEGNIATNTATNVTQDSNIATNTATNVTQNVAIADNVDNTVVSTGLTATGEETYTLEDGSVIATTTGTITYAEAAAILAAL